MQILFAMTVVLFALFSSQAHSQSQPPVTVGDVFFEENPLFCNSMDGIQYILKVTNHDGLDGLRKLLLDMRNEAREKTIEPECSLYEIPLFFSMTRFMGQLRVFNDSKTVVVWNVIEATARYREGKKFFVLTLRTIEVPRR